MSGPLAGSAEDRDWVLKAGCRSSGQDPDDWFTGGEDAGRDRRAHQAATARAKLVCATSCTVREECLAEALAREGGVTPGFRHGIWGGLTAGQRYRLWQERQRRVADAPVGPGP